jgi:transketolase C-terminal domain/subunit
MIGIAAGLTIEVKFHYRNFANFLEVYDQIRQSVAYSDKNVKSVHAGLTLEDGATHQILEDGLPRNDCNHCDYNQTKGLLALADHHGPAT